MAIAAQPRVRDRFRAGVALLATLGLSATHAGLAADTPSEAGRKPPQEWTDATFAQPYVDVDEWREKPVRHRYVHGGFRGTEAKFSIYFPPKEQYQGRFFQVIQAFAGNENTAQQQQPRMSTAVTQENTNIGFAAASGAYFVESNHGYPLSSGQSQEFEKQTVMGYRASAAVAQYSRVLASQMYGPHRPFGYAYGGSGGSLRTICGVESTYGVWDGSVPFVIGSNLSMPYVFTAPAYAYRVLQDKFPQIVDAQDPGGSGDMYAGLNEEEAAALREVTRFGFPPRAWFAHERLGYGPLAGLIDFMYEWDPGYFEDYWKEPGYLGANPPASLQRARIQHTTRIARIIMSDEARKLGLPIPALARGEGGRANVPAAIVLAGKPSSMADPKGATLIVRSGDAAGLVMSVASVSGDYVLSLGMQGQFVGDAVNRIKAGDEITIDNSRYLAAQTYQRHQVPGPDWTVWDQYRGANGEPLYPQRPTMMGPRYTRGSGGCNFSGWFNGKMIIVQTMLDEYAPPWQGDAYRKLAERALGPRTDERLRLWFVDNAMHGAPQLTKDNARIVAYTNVLQQALRDLAAWVEKGVEPPSTNNYSLVDGQIVLPPSAAARAGVQPVVQVTANGGERTEVRVGQPVQLSGAIEVPPGTGQVVRAEWDFDGSGEYRTPGKLQTSDGGARATVNVTHSFSKPGTYFPALRAASQRVPDATDYAAIENLGRARVVVR